MGAQRRRRCDVCGQSKKGRACEYCKRAEEYRLAPPGTYGGNSHACRGHAARMAEYGRRAALGLRLFDPPVLTPDVDVAEDVS